MLAANGLALGKLVNLAALHCQHSTKFDSPAIGLLFKVKVADEKNIL
jgi:hypothetical protein